MVGRPDPSIGPSLFIAVPLPESTRSAVVDLVRLVRRDPDRSDDGTRDRNDVRWVRMDGLHLTLRFLGPTPATRIPVIGGLLDHLAGTTSGFEVALSGAGAFPSMDRPRTVWLGVSDGVDALSGLVERLDAGFALAGWPNEPRPFRAHLTLARSDGVRAGPAVAAALVAATAETDFRPSFMAREIVLFESRTGHGAARYVALHQAPLKG